MNGVDIDNHAAKMNKAGGVGIAFVRTSAYRLCARKKSWYLYDEVVDLTLFKMSKNYPWLLYSAITDRGYVNRLVYQSFGKVVAQSVRSSSVTKELACSVHSSTGVESEDESAVQIYISELSSYKKAASARDAMIAGYLAALLQDPANYISFLGRGKRNRMSVSSVASFYKLTPQQTKRMRAVILTVRDRVHAKKKGVTDVFC